MIQSLFILSSTGEVLIERHFRNTTTSRSVCDIFWTRASRNVNHHGGLSTTTSLLTQEEQQILLGLDAPPIMEIPESDHGTVYVANILRDGLTYLAVLPAEVSPLMILEFLHRIADIFVDYLGSPADESAIKDNFSTVYQLLEEMVDYGYPLTTEPNSLKAMIRPPSVMAKLSSVMFSTTSSTVLSDALPSGTISNMPWRAAGVSYTQNEIYMDIVEEVDAIVDAVSGQIISSDVSGSIQCQCHLSGIPDLLLTFKDPTLIDDCSFHPCVRYARYERDTVVSFVPPDGDFELMKYSILAEKKAHFSPPLECHSQWTVGNNSSSSGSTNMNAPLGGSASGGAFSLLSPSDQQQPQSHPESARLVVQVRVKSLSSLVTSSSRNSSIRMVVEDVAVTIPLPKQVRTASFEASVGHVVYDEAGKVAKWTLGKMVDDATLTRATLTATLKLNAPSTSLSSRNSSNKGGSGSILTLGNGGFGGGMAGTSMSPYAIDGGNIDIYDVDDESSSKIRPPNMSLHWKIPLTSVSGLTVSGLSIANESYKSSCYKGVRNMTKSGLYQIRYS
jgi:AP-3 complex subunit mu